MYCIQGVASVLPRGGGGGGGGGELIFPDQKGVAEVVPDGHFSREINISFPKIVGHATFHKLSN